MTPIFFLQSVNYFVANRIEVQQHLYNIFHSSTNNKAHLIDFSNISSIRQSNVITGILPYDSYLHGGPSVESAYDVYRLRIMPQEPHLIATRSYHEDIAIYWMNYNHLPRPLHAFDKRKQQNNIIPERSGLSLSDDDEDEDDDVDMTANKHRKRKRKQQHSSNNQQATKKQKLSHNSLIDLKIAHGEN